MQLGSGDDKVAIEGSGELNGDLLSGTYTLSSGEADAAVIDVTDYENRSKLYYCQRLYHLQSRNHLGTAGSISGRYDRSTLEQGMDHRGLRYLQQQMRRYLRR